MLQYALIFESVLYTFTIIYIIFLFSLGPLPLSPHRLFLPSFLHRIGFALSLTSFLCSVSLLHVTASLSDETQEHQATPRHTNPTYTLRSPSTNTATRRPTLSDRRPPTQPHEPDPPHPQQPMARSPRHATPRRRACRAIHHVIGTSHHRISLNRLAMVGFAFGFV